LPSFLLFGVGSETVSLRRRWVWFPILLAVVLAGTCVWALLHFGGWLLVEDPLTTAHAIVVLSGSTPERAIEAARLYRQNYSAQVWVSQPASPAPELARLQIPYVGEDFYNERVLIALGVPADAIRILEKPAANTMQEVDEIASDCRRDNAHTVIVVTSKPHTRRVRIIWNRRVGSDPRLIVRYPSDDPFDAAHWWRTTGDALDVVREVLGIANAWAGFPLRPATQ
jgi:uncharacterized SAM-binding protein YcdF (DUF218 family)